MLARGLNILDGSIRGATTDKPFGLVLYPIDVGAPRSYRRRSRAIFVAGVAELGYRPEDVLKAGYPLLARSLSNVLILLAGDAESARPEVHFVTPEQGYYTVRHAGSDEVFLDTVADRLTPLATSQLVIENAYHADLPEYLWDGDEHSASITRAGLRLAELDLLPSPFPLHDLLPEEDLRHVQRLFGIGGVSYGNISARREGEQFWMSASGVDKSHLFEVGTEILLVKGFDAEQGAILLSVPPHRTPRRVSVDAIEHVMIYRAHPGVGAILHVHAWMADSPSTDVNYPCGTIQLAQEVAHLVRQADDSNRAVVGLRNHGLTITGPTMDDIFERIEGRILRQVPMS